MQLKSKPTEFIQLHSVSNGAPISVNPMLVRYFLQGDPPYENATTLFFMNSEAIIVRETYSQVAALMLLP